MTARARHRLTALLAVFTLLVGLAAPAAAEPVPGDLNEAVAINTQDGASIFRLAFSVRRVADGAVDQQNLAVAYASCVDCVTVALAFQVVLVTGEVDTVTPVNEAVAVNDQCTECVTFASATQVVLGFADQVVFTPEGQRRLHELRVTLSELEDAIDTMTLSELAAAIAAAKAELLAIIDEELVTVGRPTVAQQSEETAVVDGSTTTTSPPETTTTSTTDTTTSTTDTTVTTETTVAGA